MRSARLGAVGGDFIRQGGLDLGLDFSSAFNAGMIQGVDAGGTATILPNVIGGISTAPAWDSAWGRMSSAASERTDAVIDVIFGSFSTAFASGSGFSAGLKGAFAGVMGEVLKIGKDAIWSYLQPMFDSIKEWVFGKLRGPLKKWFGSIFSDALGQAQGMMGPPAPGAAPTPPSSKVPPIGGGSPGGGGRPTAPTAPNRPPRPSDPIPQGVPIDGPPKPPRPPDRPDKPGTNPFVQAFSFAGGSGGFQNFGRGTQATLHGSPRRSSRRTTWSG